MTVRRILAALLLLAAGLADTRAQEALVNPYPAFVALQLNGERVSEGALILRAGAEGKRFYLGAAEAKRLRLDLAARVAAVHVDNDDFYPLDGIEGVRYSFDELSQSLAIEAVPSIFSAQQITLPPPALIDATRPAIGAFITYDLISQQTDAAGASGNLTSGQAELGIFTPHGVFTQSAFGNANGPDRGLVRLDSLFTIDQPASLASLRIGDTITRAPAWAPLTRFGGVQFGTNFSTQPTLITYPLTAMSGATALPSTVDVYVNNVLSSTVNVPAGPFTLNDLPTVGGQGQLRLVVRDLLGREQVYMQSLYGSTTLLRPGLDDWTVQAGTLREDYGVASNKYGAGFASGVWRRGINDDLTVEGAAEGGRQHVALGGGATWVIGAIGQFFAAGAWSQDKPESHPDRSEGRLWVYGWERRSTTFNFGVQAKLASENFRTVANGDIPPPRREVSAFASYGFGGSSIGAGYALIERPRDDAIEFAQLTLTHSFRDWGFITLSAVKSLSGIRNNQVFVSYSLPIDFVTTASVTSSATESDRTRRTENRVSLQRNLPTGDGYGYRIDVSDQDRAIADVRYQNRAGLYSLEVARQGSSTSARVGASGSLIYMADELVVGRRVEEAFGLVQIPGFPNVRVYLDNQEIGRTNANGNLFISRLRPYQQNRLSIEQVDLPMSAEVLTLKLDATPYLKSGVVVRFPVKQSLGGIAHIVDEAGKDLPSGSVATLVDTGEQFPVAERGQTYLTGLQASNRVRVSWGGRSCALTIPFKPGDDPQPLLGTYTCRLR